MENVGGRVDVKRRHRDKQEHRREVWSGDGLGPAK